MNGRRRSLLRAVPLLLLSGRSSAADGEAAWRLLADSHCAVLLRHAQTVPGVGDPPGLRLDDCSTQRNLSAAGRAEAQRFGAGFARRGIRVDEVLSSGWCRCIDTAKLAFPNNDVRVFEPLNSFFGDGSRRQPQTAELRAYLARLSAPRRAVLVTHMVNIAALTGESVAMGEALLVQAGTANAGEVLARLVVR
jgi:phosphohistidine phosphatase SixA